MSTANTAEITNDGDVELVRNRNRRKQRARVLHCRQRHQNENNIYAKYMVHYVCLRATSSINTYLCDHSEARAANEVPEERNILFSVLTLEIFHKQRTDSGRCRVEIFFVRHAAKVVPGIGGAESLHRERVRAISEVDSLHADRIFSTGEEPARDDVARADERSIGCWYVKLLLLRNPRLTDFE